MPDSNNNISYQTIYSTQIYLNSANCDICLNGSSKSNCSFFFKDIIKIEKNAIEQRVSVVDAQIPISWYLVNETNSQIRISLNGQTATQYTFPYGNYNVNSFITLWNTILGNAWTLTFNNTINKLTFTHSTYDFVFSNGDASILSIIGFSSMANIINPTYSSTNKSLASSSVVNFAGITKVNIKSSTFALRNFDTKSKSRTRTIASIPVNAEANGIAFYNNFTQYKSIFHNKELSMIHIEIADDNKNLLNMNGVDWTITLQVDIVCEVVNNLDTLEDVYLNLQQELF